MRPLDFARGDKKKGARGDRGKDTRGDRGVEKLAG